MVGGDEVGFLDFKLDFWRVLLGFVDAVCVFFVISLVVFGVFVGFFGSG